MATVHGRRVNLGITDPGDEEAAVAAFRQLLAGAKPTGKPQLPAGEAIDGYIAGLRVGRGTKHIYAQFLRHFRKALGATRDLRTLTAADVEATATATWAPSTSHGYLGCVSVFLRAVGVSLDRKIKRPQKESRGAIAVWSDEDYYRIVGASRADFRALVQTLWLTGARPSEALSLTVEIIDWKGATATLRTHKNATKNKPRVLHFPEPVMVVLRKQKDKYGTGPIFRQGQGCRHPEKPMTMKGAGARMVNARERAGIEHPLFLYGLRHGFITRALSKGFTADQVAALVGNSAAIIRQHYSHVGADHDLMKRIADSVAG